MEEFRRVVALDHYRGFIIILMIFLNFLSHFDAIPSSLKHAPPLGGITIVDFGVPVFLFILGVSSILSLEGRIQEGCRKIVRHLVFRYSTLFLLGIAGIALFESDPVYGWNVLASIGLSGALIIPFLFLGPFLRLLAGLSLVAFYQVFILRFHSGAVLDMDMGGYLGAISWGGFILMSSFWAGSLKGTRWRTYVWGSGFALVFCVTGVVLGEWIPINKPLISLPYICVSYALSILGLLIFLILEDFTRREIRILWLFGRNSLLIYMVQASLALFLQTLLSPSLALPYALSCGLLIFGLCLGLACYLNERRLYVKL